MIDYTNPALTINSGRIRSGRIVWRSPSNIALIKYWGKHGRQMPSNPSISFTLESAFTETVLEYGPKMTNTPGISVDFLFHGAPNKPFAAKINQFLTSLLPIFPFLADVELTIFSSNSFPHSAGIASSASSMSALALCLCSLEDDLFGTLTDDTAFERKASYVARLGSGSAARSIYSVSALWGETHGVPSSSDYYAVSWAGQLDPVFKTFHDDILIVSRDEKSHSSTVGHKLMKDNPYAESRYMDVRNRMKQILPALKSGDLELFGDIVEKEAFALHGLMMLSNPPYMLVKSGTISIIEKVIAFRQTHKIPLYFTLDAGPNVHLLYPDQIKKKVNDFIKNDLLKFTVDGSFIPDKVGQGPIQV